MFTSTDTMGYPPTPSLFNSTVSMGTWYPTIARGTWWLSSTILRTYISWVCLLFDHEYAKLKAQNHGTLQKCVHQSTKNVIMEFPWLEHGPLLNTHFLRFLILTSLFIRSKFSFPTVLNVTLPFLNYKSLLWVYQIFVCNPVLLCMYIYTPNTYIPASLIKIIKCWLKYIYLCI